MEHALCGGGLLGRVFGGDCWPWAGCRQRGLRPRPAHLVRALFTHSARRQCAGVQCNCVRALSGVRGRHSDELQRAQEGARPCVRECARASRLAPASRIASMCATRPRSSLSRRKNKAEFLIIKHEMPRLAGPLPC